MPTGSTGDVQIDELIQRRQWAVVAVALAVLVVILLPCLVRISPVHYFDQDPRGVPFEPQLIALGPTGAAWLHSATVALAGIAMVVSVMAGIRVRWFSTMAVAVGVGFCMVHMSNGPVEDLLQCGAWISAASLALAVLHLSQIDLARRWCVAGLVAVLFPMTIRTGWSYFYEHRMTLEHFRLHKKALLQSRGWEEGSAQHTLFQRRLENYEAVGTFDLANVYGSIVTALVVLAIALAIGLLLVRSRRYWVLVAPGAAIAGSFVLGLTNSRGAVIALGLILGLLLVWLSLCNRPRLFAVLVFATVLMASGIVLLRGQLGPPAESSGQLSLLFRYHYWQAAYRLLVHDLPESLLLGVGPTGFRQGYLWAKNPLNPEQVTAGHNVFVDYITMLGVGGWAFSAVLLGWLGGAASCNVWRESSSELTRRLPLRTAAFGAFGLAAVLFGAQYIVHLPELTLAGWLLWIAALLAFGATAMAMVHLPVPVRWLRIGLVLAATSLLVHNQIEMSFFDLSAAPVVWCIVAMAAGTAGIKSGCRLTGRLRFMVPAAAVVLSGVLYGFYVMPIRTHQAHLATAQESLRSGKRVGAIEALDQASKVVPGDQRTTRWQVYLRIEQAVELVRAGAPLRAEALLEQALRILDQAQRAVGPVSWIERLRSRVYEQGSAMLHEPKQLDLAVQAMGRVLDLSPYSLPDQLHVGDLWWDLGRQEAAKQAYRRVLKLNEDQYLDSAVQLPLDQLVRIKKRLNSGIREIESPKHQDAKEYDSR